MQAEQYISWITEKLEERQDAMTQVSRTIWEKNEIGHEEYTALSLLTQVLREGGFSVETGIAGFETAFLGVKKSEKPGPVVAFIAEYDALINLGHACAHNLFCSSAVNAAVVLGELLDELGGEIRVIGSPAEEGGVPNYGTKAVLVEQGYFSDVDCVFTAHGECETVIERCLAATKSVKVHFTGVAVHAGGSPELGVNALTAGTLCIQNVNGMRQHLVQGDVVNAIMTEGGILSNTIPDNCRLEFSIRSKTEKRLGRVMEILENSVKAAALVTGCGYELEVVKNPMKDTRSNHQLGLVMAEYLDRIGEPYLTYDERNYAWDVGDVSYACPTLGSYFKIGPSDIVCHTEAFRQAANSPEGYRGMMTAAKGMAVCACEFLMNPELREAARKEFLETRTEQ